MTLVRRSSPLGQLVSLRQEIRRGRDTMNRERVTTNQTARAGA